MWAFTWCNVAFQDPSRKRVLRSTSRCCPDLLHLRLLHQLTPSTKSMQWQQTTHANFTAPESQKGEPPFPQSLLDPSFQSDIFLIGERRIYLFSTCSATRFHLSDLLSTESLKWWRKVLEREKQKPNLWPFKDLEMPCKNTALSLTTEQTSSQQPPRRGYKPTNNPGRDVSFIEWCGLPSMSKDSGKIWSSF